MIGFIALAVIGVMLLLALVGSSRWAASRNWVFNKHNPRPSGHGVPQLLDEIYNPSVRHVIEEEASEATRADQRESGAAPNAD